MRNLKFEEIQEVNGGDIDDVLVAATAMDLGAAVIGGLAFGPIGAVGAAAAYGAGFLIGMGINKAMED
jgi:hypothetical protein